VSRALLASSARSSASARACRAPRISDSTGGGAAAARRAPRAASASHRARILSQVHCSTARLSAAARSPGASASARSPAASPAASSCAPLHPARAVTPGGGSRARGRARPGRPGRRRAPRGRARQVLRTKREARGRRVTAHKGATARRVSHRPHHVRAPRGVRGAGGPHGGRPRCGRARQPGLGVASRETAREPRAPRRCLKAPAPPGAAVGLRAVGRGGWTRRVRAEQGRKSGAGGRRTRVGGDDVTVQLLYLCGGRRWAALFERERVPERRLPQGARVRRGAERRA
jgi:hypothetical protein